MRLRIMGKFELSNLFQKANKKKMNSLGIWADTHITNMTNGVSMPLQFVL